MLTRRIIPCLDVRDGKVVKGIRFANHRIVGDILELAMRYSDDGADELGMGLKILASAFRRRKSSLSMKSMGNSRILRARISLTMRVSKPSPPPEPVDDSPLFSKNAPVLWSFQGTGVIICCRLGSVALPRRHLPLVIPVLRAV